MIDTTAADMGYSRSSPEAVEFAAAQGSSVSHHSVVDRPMDLPTIVHLAASPFLGGPERQMIGLARALRGRANSIFWSFGEGGRCQPFLDEVEKGGFVSETLRHNAPNYRAAINEIVDKLKTARVDVLLCHGYKPDLLGGLAARRAGVPVVAVCRGWTGATLKVRVNELLDRFGLLQMDRVVCVSAGQAAKVRRAGIPPRRIRTIRNAINVERFDRIDPDGRRDILGLFPNPPKFIVGAAGRFSPEKGFDILIAAAERVIRRHPDAGFVLFGEGPLKETLESRVAAENLEGRFLLAPFRGDLDRVLPHLDVLAISSHTEGLPNVALEASAARVPVVATDVGGIPEVIDDGVTGYLAPADDPGALASRIAELLTDRELRLEMGERGRERVLRLFSFESQAESYLKLIEELASRSSVGVSC